MEIESKEIFQGTNYYNKYITVGMLLSSSIFALLAELLRPLMWYTKDVNR